VATYKTPNINLNKWALTDYVRMDEFNENFDKIDDEIGNLNTQLARTETNLDGRGINIKYPPAPFVGAKGDGVTDDRLAIQAIIDSGVDAIYIPEGTFVVSHDGVTYDGKGTGVGLKLRSNLKIYGTGTIKYKGGQGGSFAVLANVDDYIENCHIEGITIDGNKDNLNPNASVSNIVLFGANNCSFKELNLKMLHIVG